MLQISLRAPQVSSAGRRTRLCEQHERSCTESTAPSGPRRRRGERRDVFLLLKGLRLCDCASSFVFFHPTFANRAPDLTRHPLSPALCRRPNPHPPYSCSPPPPSRSPNMRSPCPSGSATANSTSTGACVCRAGKALFSCRHFFFGPKTPFCFPPTPPRPVQPPRTGVVVTTHTHLFCFGHFRARSRHLRRLRRRYKKKN